MAHEVDSGIGGMGLARRLLAMVPPAMAAILSPPAAAVAGAPEAAAAAAGGDGRWRRFAYFGYALHLFTVFGLALSNILLGLTLALAPRALAERRVRWGVLQPVLLPMGFYLVFLTASILLSYDVRTSLFSFGETFAMATLYLGPGLVRGERELRRLVDGMIAVAAVLALRSISQYLWSFGELDQRIRGPYSHYMIFSGVLLIGDVLLLTQMVCGRAAWRSVWRWIALASINAALLGTMTRGAWVALGGTLCCLLAVHGHRAGRGRGEHGAGPRHRGRQVAAICALALLVVFLVVPASVLHRAASILDLRDRSNYDRLCMLDAGLRMIAERPFVGLGPDMVDHRYEIYRQPTAPRYWVPHLHDSFLEMAAERGLPSLAAYLWMMIAGVRLALRRYRAEGGLAGPRAELYLGSVLALLAFNLAGLFENNWGDAVVKRLALFVLMMPFCLELADTESAAVPAASAAPAGDGGAGRQTAPSTAGGPPPPPPAAPAAPASPAAVEG
jgi:O-antigen ligase